MRTNLPVTGREYKLGTNDFLISRTDRGGRITYANHAFIEVSGFSREELLGQPHNIVRHPDMPPAAFADLWATLKSGETWVGLVKNRRKDGDHYWVHAHVAPIVEDGELQGYVSMRTKADDASIDRAEIVYGSMREGDDKHIVIHRGAVRHRSIFGWLRRLDLRSVSTRLAVVCATSMLLLVASTVLGLYRAGVSEMAGGAWWVAQWAVLIGGLGVLALMWSTVGRAITTPLDQAMKFTVQIAAGNLAAKSPAVVRNDEIGRLLVALDVMRKSLNSIVGYVHQNVSVVEPEAHDIACGNEDLSTRTEQQAGFLQDTASSMEEIMAAAEQNANHARDASQLVATTTTVVKGSGELMGSVVATMGRISDGSSRIATIVDVIDSIAFQTNILALNASVEAARAGESGRGFAVVAGEVRNLAGRSAEAAREIRGLIDTSSSEVAEGARLVERAEKAIEDVVVSVTRVNELMGEIAVASGEQSIGIGGVNSSVVEMDVVTQQNTSRVQQTARAAAVLDHQISELAYAMKVFRVNGGVESAQASKVTTRAREEAGEPKRAVA